MGHEHKIAVCMSAEKALGIIDARSLLIIFNNLLSMSGGVCLKQYFIRTIHGTVRNSEVTNRTSLNLEKKTAIWYHYTKGADVCSHILSCGGIGNYEDFERFKY